MEMVKPLVKPPVGDAASIGENDMDISFVVDPLRIADPWALLPRM